MTDIRDDARAAHPAAPSPILAPSGAPGIGDALARTLAGRYDVQREIGRGGSAIVFLARHRARNANVAIKVLRPEFAHALHADRFVREVEIARRLDHPNILSLLDSGSLGELPYFVMPYIEGDTLRTRLKRERHLPIDEALRITRGVAETLDYAHGLGLVHRDIKPANILLGPDGIVVADFGIARAIAESAVLGPAAITIGTPSGVAIGTPEYMSPEQATADSSVDGRADIYSLACLLYEMLAGEPPFSGPTPAAVVAKHLHQAPPSLRVVRPTVPPGLQRAVEKALAKVPADRFATAGELIAALDAVPKEELPSRPRGWRRRLAALAIVLAVGVSGVWLAPAASRAWQRYTARIAFDHGLAALERWDLPNADSAFRLAAERDSGDAQALVHLAMVRLWRGAPLSQWRFAAEQAAQTGRLSSRDALVATALIQLAGGRRDAACERWRELTRQEPRVFAAWYGLGHCLAWDSTVVRDAHAAGGWRFRSSVWEAQRAYQRAIDVRRSISGAWVVEVGRLLHVSASWVRTGRAAPPDTTTFVAFPSWGGDSVVLVPMPTALFDRSSPRNASGADEAALHARQRFYTVSQMWRARFPESPDALEALSSSLDLLANASAFDTLRAVRRYARTADDRIRLGAREVWLRVKYSVPDRLDELRQARGLADSLLQAFSPATTEQARQLAGLAALTGHAYLAARYSRLERGPGTEPALQASAPALVAYAALGGSRDSLAALAVATERGIDNGVVAANRDAARAEWMVRAAVLSLPDSTVAVRIAPGTQPPLDLLTAWRAHDLRAVQRILAGWRADPRRRTAHASDVTPDGIYVEAAALASLGDSSGALATLAPTLDSLSLASPQRLADAPRAAALVRALILRARVAASLGDTTMARRWAMPALVLWSDADEFLKSSLEPLRRLAP